MAASARYAASSPAVPHRSWRGRLIALVLGAMSAILRLLPDRTLHRVAHALGGLLYRVQPERRALVRANLRRVCTSLASTALGSTTTTRASSDEQALERLVREAFGHYVRGYLEAVIVATYADPRRIHRVVPDDPELLDELLGTPGETGRAAIVVGLHFGAMEIPALHAVATRGVRMTAPMETIDDPDLQAYLLRTRGSTGLRIIPTRGAGRELAETLRVGQPVVIVADRVVAGAGARVELFGATARLPLGPAVLALETGAPVFVVAARRTGWGEYRARIERLETPADGSRRERLAAFLQAQARLFERIVADAPEQWWALFFPIWEPQPGTGEESRA